MKKIITLILICFSITLSAQNDAKKLLDEVSSKMGAYKNMVISFNSVLENKDAGVKEAPVRGNVTIQGDKYFLKYIGNDFIFNGSSLAVINHAEKEVTTTEGDLEEEDGFIYPSKLLTFYKEGYNFNMGKSKNKSGRKLQTVILNPIDSSSEIVKVMLVVDAKTKHIYQLIQIGSNGAETTFTITALKSNQNISKNLFNFDKDKLEKLGYLID